MHHGEITKDIAMGLLVLNERIKAAKIPASKLDETLNIATWNIREFGKKKRLPASLHYIAEIMGQFDLVAVLGAHGSNLGKDKRYDQSLHLEEFTNSFTGAGGVLDFYADDHKPLYPGTKLNKDEVHLRVVRPCPAVGADQHRQRRGRTRSDPEPQEVGR